MIEARIRALEEAAVEFEARLKRLESAYKGEVGGVEEGTCRIPAQGEAFFPVHPEDCHCLYCHPERCKRAGCYLGCVCGDPAV